jgi:DNA-binding LytR/AlgR family response regulator
MRSLIVDDEESARARLTRMLASHPEIVVEGEARDGLEAVEKIEAVEAGTGFSRHPDARTDRLRGAAIAARNGAMPLVIFVTGYDQHALAAFEANALAYLLKPVDPERLAKRRRRALKLSADSGGAEREREHVLKVARESPKSLRQIVCRKRDRLVLVPPEQIFSFHVETGS